MASGYRHHPMRRFQSQSVSAEKCQASYVLSSEMVQYFLTARAECDSERVDQSAE